MEIVADAFAACLVYPSTKSDDDSEMNDQNRAVRLCMCVCVCSAVIVFGYLVVLNYSCDAYHYFLFFCYPCSIIAIVVSVVRLCMYVYVYGVDRQAIKRPNRFNVWLMSMLCLRFQLYTKQR